jgi:biotin operon repressor
MSFAAQKAAWIGRILLDQNITHLSFRVAVLIGRYLNRTSGDAWPSQRRLAAELGVTTRAIQLCLDGLVAAGYLNVKVSKGRGHTNRYRPIFETGNTNHSSPIDGQKGEPGFAIIPSKIRTGEPENTNGGALKHERPFVQNSSKRTLSKRTVSKNEGKSLTMTDQSRSDFEAFWHAYPKKVDKLRAEKLFANLLKSKRASVEQLIAGANRYATERAGQDPTYTKHASTWLNAGGWLDEPKTQSKFVKPNRADSAIAGMRGYLEEGSHE